MKYKGDISKNIIMDAYAKALSDATLASNGGRIEKNEESVTLYDEKNNALMTFTRSTYEELMERVRGQDRKH
jgi:hypothetical protein